MMEREITKLIDMQAQLIRLLVDGASVNIAWCNGVRGHAEYILALADEVEASLMPRSPTEVN